MPLKNLFIIVICVVLCVGAIVAVGHFSIQKKILPPTISLSPTPQVIQKNDYSSWKIVQVCIPVASLSGDPSVVIDLHDGTFIYKSKDGTLFRGTKNNCRCLASNTAISTATGAVNVTQLRVGMQVWTVNKNGQKELKPLVRISSVFVGNDYVISHLSLKDGRNLFVSASHPTSTGHFIRDLTKGDMYNNSVVDSNMLISYSDRYTYDLLPAGDTGFYYANGILVGSTLK